MSHHMVKLTACRNWSEIERCKHIHRRLAITMSKKRFLIIGTILLALFVIRNNQVDPAESYLIKPLSNEEEINSKMSIMERDLDITAAMNRGRKPEPLLQELAKEQKINLRLQQHPMAGNMKTMSADPAS